MELPNSYFIAWKALRRNRLQTGLTMLGMTIGVATVLTMIALGSGAQKAIQDQVKAAGMNVLVVTAGNYQAQKEKPPDDAIEMGRLNAPAEFSRPHLIEAAFHPEDDPFAVHDHPTARQRLGDSEAGLGSAATLTIDDANAVRPRIRQICAGRLGRGLSPDWSRAERARSSVRHHVHLGPRLAGSELHVSIVRTHVRHQQFSGQLQYVP